MSEYIAYQETDKGTGIRLRVVQDSDSSRLSPTENDKAIIFAVLHRHYVNPAKGASARDNVPWVKDEDGQEVSPDFESSEGLDTFAAQACGEGKDWEAFPLFMYDHSDTIYRCSQAGNPFSCPWDSGQVGFIFVHKPSIGGEALKAAESFCAVYTDWANGNVWGYVIEDKNKEHLDSCWGFIGASDDPCMMEQARASLEYAKIEAREQANKKLAVEKQIQSDIETVRLFVEGDNRALTRNLTRDALNRLYPRA